MKNYNERIKEEEKELAEKVKRCYITSETLKIINKYNLDKKGKEGEDKYVKSN